MNFLDLPSVGCPSLGLGAYPRTACIAKLRNAHTTPNHGGPGGCWQWTASRHNPCNQGLADFLSLYNSVLLSAVKHHGGGEASLFVFVTAVACGGLCWWRSHHGAEGPVGRPLGCRLIPSKKSYQSAQPT